MSTFDDPEILRAVLEGLPTGVYVVGRNGKILFWNCGAERITGHLRQDVVGHACREDFLGSTEGAKDQIPGVCAGLDDVLKDGKPAESEVAFRHKSGHLVPVKLRAFAVRDREGKIVAVVECFDELLDLVASNRRHDKLAEFGCLDPASGVLTHKMVEARLRECLATYAEQPVPFCIVCIAFDHLDEIKARYGAGALAAVLRVAGQTLENCLRPTDYMGRWQENEFLAIVVECNRSEISRVGERLRRMIGSAKIAWWGDSLPLAIAMGATAVKPQDTAAEMMRRAEGALREGILQGGNRIVVWDE